MYYRTIRNDILKSKAISLTTILFVAAAAMLLSLAAILVVNLTGAIDTLMTQAKTPHFMQMHAGDIDTPALAAFADQQENVDAFQVVEFLNMEGAQIVFEQSSLANSVQDNGFTTQNATFDHLLDLDGNVIQVATGEVYVPLCYMRDGSTQVGEQMLVAGQEFVVAGFLRDSQMNSLLSSSKRFLVSQDDFSAIKTSGTMEYLIEFRLNDLSNLAAFETAYTNAGLDANGPTLTYPFYKLINAVSDGMMVGVILLVSVLVIAIAFLCIRFTLLAKIEEDFREIGVMKAIGLRVSDIKKIYLAKYAALAAVGSLIGLALAFALRGMLLENIRLFMGESENASLALLFGLVSVVLMFLAVMLYVNSVLQRFRKISPAEAIRFGTAQEKSTLTKRLNLATNKLLNTNVFLGIKDVFSRKKIYVTLLAVLAISAFIVIVPQNLYNTISSESFSAYMGVGSCDLRIDIQQTDNIAAKTVEIATAMQNDPAISKYVVLTTKTFRVHMADGSEERLKVDLGDHSVFPVQYSEGREPQSANEIALSELNAREMEKMVGDILTLEIGGQAQALMVSGIYSDITNGGKTAKAVFIDDSADSMKSVIAAGLSDQALVNQKTTEYADRFGFAKVSSINEFVMQTFGSTITAVEMASQAAIAVALLTSVLVTLLFMRMLIAKDRYSIAVMKAFGYTNRDITIQYIARSVLVLLSGILLGTLLANTLGESLAGLAISSFGASSFAFVVNPVFAYLLSPLMMVVAVLAATVFGTLDAGKMKISENIKE
jgi:putative ABC transport system permease protein